MIARLSPVARAATGAKGNGMKVEYLDLLSEILHILAPKPYKRANGAVILKAAGFIVMNHEHVGDGLGHCGWLRPEKCTASYGLNFTVVGFCFFSLKD